MFTEKHFEKGEPVFWFNEDGTVTDGVVTAVSLYPSNKYITVLWDDCASDAVYRSEQPQMFNQVHKKDVAVLPKRHAFYHVTNIEFEEI